VNRPSIVLVTCHDLGTYLHCYGVPTPTTPNLDRLAGEGLQFTNAFCVAPQCSPSRSAIATGRYPHSNGVMGLTHHPFDWDLYPDEKHIAQMLKDLGYATFLLGHQHVTTNPSRLGFDLMFHDRRGEAVVDEFRRIVQAHDFQASPAYFEINLNQTHRPYEGEGLDVQSQREVFVPGFLPEAPESRDEMLQFYRSVEVADKLVGDVLEIVDQYGLRNEIIFVFTTDHGIAMPRAKCTLYDPGLRVSLLLRWPAGSFPTGQKIDSLVSNVDILPTLLAMIGIDPLPEFLQGKSFLPSMADDRAVRDEVFAEKTFHSYYDPMRAIRTDRYKYIVNFESSFLVEVPGDIQMGVIFRRFTQLYSATQHPVIELYDLESDPLEQHNLAGNPDYADIERDLRGRLLQWMEATDDPLLQGPVASPSYRKALNVLKESP